MKKFFTIALMGLIGYGIYFVADETKILARLDCLGLGGTPVKISEVGSNTLKNEIVCAEPTIDANKECYDSSDCDGDCILERYSDGYAHAGEFIDKNGRDRRGYCQPYKEMDCYVSRDRGIIVIHKCASE